MISIYRGEGGSGGRGERGGGVADEQAASWTGDGGQPTDTSVQERGEIFFFLDKPDEATGDGERKKRA